MPTLVHGELKHHTRHKPDFNIVYLAMVFFGIHWSVVLYVNSTYLNEFISTEVTGTLYTIGAALSVFSFLFISRVLQKIGNYRLTLGLAVIEILAMLGLAFFPMLQIAVPLFVLHIIIAPLIVFNLDVFTELLIGKKEDNTGSKRGVILTVMSISTAVAPLLAGNLLGDADPRFHLVYLASAFFLVPFCALLYYNFRNFNDPKYSEVKVLRAMHAFWIRPNLRFVFLAHFLLQLFFAWMVIYVPLYLSTVVGLAWDDIGLILFVGLMAYVFLEYPIGLLADKRFGEKEMMGIGFIILAVSTAWISFVASASVIPWMVTMFMTRVGASFVEATTESYFFKHTKGTDANVISFFRITRPLALVIGALLGSLTLLYTSIDQMFIVLGLLMIPGIIFTLFLEDTK